MTNQGLRQASVRASTGTTLDYNGDWHALFDDAGIAAGEFNGRMLAWINQRLSASHTNINEAMAAFAAAEGVSRFSDIGTFSISTFSMTVNAPAVVGVFGNSFASQNWNTYTSTSLDRRAQGYATQLAFITHQKVRAVKAGNFGVSGEALTAMLARRATAIAYNPDIWILCDICANDLTNTGKSASAMITDINTLVADFAATDKLVIIANSTPRNDTSWLSLSSGDRADRVVVQNTVRAHIATLPSTYSNVFIVDVWDETIDPMGSDNAPLSGYFYDGLHPSPWTGYLLAKKMKEIIDARVTFNFSTALPSTSGSKNTNPTITGTSGTLNTGFTGTVANNMRVERVSGTPSGVCSKDTISIGGNSQTVQKVVISPGSLATDELRVFLEHPEIALSFTGGTDNFYAISRVKIENPVGILGINLQCIINMTTGTDPQTNDVIRTSGQSMYPETVEGTFQTEVLAVPAGARTSDRLILRVFIDSTVVGAGCTLYVGQTEYRA